MAISRPAICRGNELTTVRLLKAQLCYLAHRVMCIWNMTNTICHRVLTLKLEWCALKHMMLPKWETSAWRHSEKKMYRGWFDMGNSSFFPLYCFPLPSFPLLALPDFVENMLFTWGKCNILPLLFNSFSDFPLTGNKHSRIHFFFFPGWTAPGISIYFQNSSQVGVTGTCFSTQMRKMTSTHSMKHGISLIRFPLESIGQFFL